MGRALKRLGTTTHGFTMIELLVVVGIISVVAVIAMPQTSRTVAGMRLRSDGRNVANAISLAKMRAGSGNTRTRVAVTAANGSYVLQIFNRTTNTWQTEGGTMQLSPGVSFGFGSVPTPPPDTQVNITQSPPCLDNSSPAVAIAGTHCINFNSRGIPINGNGDVHAEHGIYITDGTGVYVTTITATPLIRRWWSPANTAAWVKQ